MAAPSLSTPTQSLALTLNANQKNPLLMLLLTVGRFLLQLKISTLK
jgi:hypothetical protein